MVLDTENTNYSYGNLQKVLKKGLLEIVFEKIKKFENILILGVAGGSVIKTLVDEINFKGKIIGVEIDQEIIEIANKYFDLDKIKNFEINIDNAEEFVKNDLNCYNLIIIDIFQDNFMPNFLFEKEFVHNIVSRLTKNGNLIFNTMVLKIIDEQRNKVYCSFFDENLFEISKISKLEKFNELIVIKSKKI